MVFSGTANPLTKVLSLLISGLPELPTTGCQGCQTVMKIAIWATFERLSAHRATVFFVLHLGDEQNV